MAEAASPPADPSPERRNFRRRALTRKTAVPNVNVLYIHTEALVVLAAKMDEYGKAGWIAATGSDSGCSWPLGVALLLFLAFSGRSPAGGEGRVMVKHAGQHVGQHRGRARPGLGLGLLRRRPASRLRAEWQPAFDNYREETLRGLEEEQREFIAYLDRLRKARDKAEFDAFMADRRRRAEPDGGVPEAPPA